MQSEEDGKASKSESGFDDFIAPMDGLIEIHDYIPSRFYSLLDGDYKQDDAGAWWFRPRCRDFPLISPALMRAFQTYNEEDKAAAMADLEARSQAQEKIPWRKCEDEGPCRPLEITEELLDDVAESLGVSRP